MQVIMNMLEIILEKTLDSLIEISNLDSATLLSFVLRRVLREYIMMNTRREFFAKTGQ